MDQVRDFIEKHGDSRFVRIGEATEKNDEFLNLEQTRIYDRAGFKEEKPDGIYYYVMTAGFKEMTKGRDRKIAETTLSDAGILILHKGEMMRSKKIPGHGTHRVYTLKLDESATA